MRPAPGVGRLDFLLGFTLMYGDRRKTMAYAFPFLLGIVIGVLTSALILAEAGQWVSAPFVLLVLTLPGFSRLYRR
jgi:hypothetical protein